jgi:pyruvate kinase
MRKTKIVVTFGPALLQGDVLREVLKEADVVRLNASHGDPESRLVALTRVRQTARELGRLIPVFLDLQGPKWRVGVMETPVDLAKGSEGWFHRSRERAPEGTWAVPLDHPELYVSAAPGQRWLLDDGNVEVDVLEVSGSLVKARVRNGGLLKSRKGVHPVGVDVAVEALTEKDKLDVAWGVANKVDLFAQSFVRRGEDVVQLRKLVADHGGAQPIIAKIEHPKALENLAAILEPSWGVMVARGDMGVEMGVERVPTLQKRVIREARMALKPVITATQMLESMIENPNPTRAEASDVANAVWDGTDAVMLSAESATGKYPVETVGWLARIAREADNNFRVRVGPFHDELKDQMKGRVELSVAFSASRTAEDIGARWIVAFTMRGGTARLISRVSGKTPVIAATPDESTAHTLGLLRGVTPILIPRMDSTNGMMAKVREILMERQQLVPGDNIVMTLGLPLWQSGATDTMKVLSL